MDQTNSEFKQKFTDFHTKLDNGFELNIGYTPSNKQLIIRGENLNTQKDYELVIMDEDLKKIDSPLAFTSEQFYWIILDCLQGQDDSVKAQFSDDGAIEVNLKVAIRKQTFQIRYNFKMSELEVTQQFKVEKLHRKVNQLQKEKELMQKTQNLLQKEVDDLKKRADLKSTVVPRFHQNHGFGSHYTFPDPYSAIRNVISSNNTTTLFAIEPLKPQGISIFKLQIVFSVHQPTPYILVGIAAKRPDQTLVGQKQAYFINCQNGNMQNEKICMTYANYPSIYNGEVITVTVDMDQGQINFYIPSPSTNKKVKMTGFDKTQLFPFVQLTYSTDSVKFVE